MRRFAFLAPIAVLSLALAADPASSPAPKPPPEEEMFKVQLVMLKVGPNRDEPAADDPRQAEHLKGLEALMKSGKALAVGPIENGGDIRGLVVLDVESKAEAERLLAKDPWIVSGHLAAEYHTWFVAKKLFRPLKGAFTDVEACTFALLVRPPAAPEISADEKALIQEGHMANINAMAKAGELAIAGPFEEDTPLRGVFVFRSTDRAKVEGLVAKDPAVARGRLKVEPFTWYVSKGVLPAAGVP
jgi:uncharacterized protein YciI